MGTFHLRQLLEYFKITESIYIQDLLKSVKLAWSLEFNLIRVRSVARVWLRLGSGLNPTPTLTLTLAIRKIEFQAASSKTTSHITLNLLKGFWVPYCKKKNLHVICISWYQNHCMDIPIMALLCYLRYRSVMLYYEVFPLMCSTTQNCLKLMKKELWISKLCISPDMGWNRVTIVYMYRQR